MIRRLTLFYAIETIHCSLAQSFAIESIKQHIQPPLGIVYHLFLGSLFSCKGKQYLQVEITNRCVLPYELHALRKGLEDWHAARRDMRAIAGSYEQALAYINLWRRSTHGISALEVLALQQEHEQAQAVFAAAVDQVAFATEAEACSKDHSGTDSVVMALKVDQEDGFQAEVRKSQRHIEAAA